MNLWRGRLFARLGVLLLLLPGCSVIGLAVGGATKKHETRAATPYAARSGDTVEVVFQDSMGTYAVIGTYEGTIQNELVVLTEAGVFRIPVAQAKTMRIQTGTYWVEGVLSGLAIDAVVIAVAASTTLGTHYSSTSYQSHGFDFGK